LADASYCTQLNTDTPIPVLLAAAWEIMQALELPSYKRRLEQLTWMEFRNGALQVPA
jgi:hypothetical protein